MSSPDRFGPAVARGLLIVSSPFHAAPAGWLYYVIGPSGAGKDSLMAFARRRIDRRAAVLFAHRYITRPPRVGDENHVSVTKYEFEQRLRLGLFAMHWESHGTRYGIGIEILAWLRSGAGVVVNGSRAYLPTARRRYPRLRPILVTAPLARLRERLQDRDRETDAEIDERMRRGARQSLAVDPDLIVIRNDGAIEQAGALLTRVLVEQSAAS